MRPLRHGQAHVSRRDGAICGNAGGIPYALSDHSRPRDRGQGRRDRQNGQPLARICGAGAQDRRPRRHVSRHSLRQVLVLPEHVRLSAVPEHQRLRQRLHLRGQPASHGRLGRLHLCPQGRLRVQGSRGHGAAHRGHVGTHDLHLQSRQGQRALHHGRRRLRLRRDHRRPGRGPARPPACAQSPADGRRDHHRDRPLRFPASTGEGFRRRSSSSA